MRNAFCIDTSFASESTRTDTNIVFSILLLHKHNHLNDSKNASITRHSVDNMSCIPFHWSSRLLGIEFVFLFGARSLLVLSAVIRSQQNYFLYFSSTSKNTNADVMITFFCVSFFFLFKLNYVNWIYVRYVPVVYVRLNDIIVVRAAVCVCSLSTVNEHLYNLHFLRLVCAYRQGVTVLDSLHLVASSLYLYVFTYTWRTATSQRILVSSFFLSSFVSKQYLDGETNLLKTKLWICFLYKSCQSRLKISFLHTWKETTICLWNFNNFFDWSSGMQMEKSIVIRASCI